MSVSYAIGTALRPIAGKLGSHREVETSSFARYLCVAWYFDHIQQMVDLF